MTTLLRIFTALCLLALTCIIWRIPTDLDAAKPWTFAFALAIFGAATGAVLLLERGMK